MKITKTGDTVKLLELNKNLANLNCTVCPTCGETKLFIEYLRGGIADKGINDGICKNYTKGIFKIKCYQVDCYNCYTCGTHWESEGYLI